MPVVKPVRPGENFPMASPRAMSEMLVRNQARNVRSFARWSASHPQAAHCHAWAQAASASRDSVSTVDETRTSGGRTRVRDLDLTVIGAFEFGPAQHALFVADKGVAHSWGGYTRCQGGVQTARTHNDMRDTPRG